MKKTIWITWENHRRSKELAKAFGAELVVMGYSEKALWRYPASVIQTILVLLLQRPKILFVQNPSMILATLASVLKPVFQYNLIIDRHSNFRFSTMHSRSLKWRIFHILSRYTVRKADTTIVTVESLKKLVNEWGGRAVMLQDKTPEMNVNKQSKRALNGDFNIICVSTFVADEPIFEIVKAAKLIDDNIHIYMTGKFQNFPQIGELQLIKPENVTFTGFVSENDYEQLLYSADAIMVLTVLEDLLTCGAYEAVGLDKPMILSNTKAISNYFFKGAAYANPDRISISEAILLVKENYGKYLKDVVDLRSELDVNWLKKFKKIEVKIKK